MTTFKDDGDGDDLDYNSCWWPPSAPPPARWSWFPPRRRAPPPSQGQIHTGPASSRCPSIENMNFPKDNCCRLKFDKQQSTFKYIRIEESDFLWIWQIRKTKRSSTCHLIGDVHLSFCNLVTLSSCHLIRSSPHKWCLPSPPCLSRPLSPSPALRSSSRPPLPCSGTPRKHNLISNEPPQRFKLIHG